jgi:ribosomal protein S27AE
MTRSLLHTTVARLTGESLATIQRIGFGLDRRGRPADPDADDPLAVLDCPFCGATVILAWDNGDDLPEFADCRRCGTAFSYAAHEVYDADLNDIAAQPPLACAHAA